MRVITGIAKGRKLKAPKGMETRPTSDRTKESLFNIIGNKILNVKFLDLYAGTGAVGIEAISRGAEKSVLVEKNPKAVKIIRENLELTGLNNMAEILALEANEAIEKLTVQGIKFEIIFMDPPWLKDLEKACLKKIAEKTLLAQGGLIITESSKLDVLPKEVGRFKMYRQDKYGDTILSFYQEF